MSAFGLFLAAIGALIICTRGPLIVAPQATRSFYMRLIGERMRGWGVIAGVIGAAFMLAAQTTTGIAASISFWLGVFIVTLGFTSMMFFPKKMRAVAETAWGSFSEPVLRLLGVVSVAAGALLIYYGMQF